MGHLEQCRFAQSTRPEGVNLSDGEIADIRAWSDFIRAKGQPLVDLYLYVSSENYHEATKLEWAKSLPWIAKSIIPSQRRTVAKERTAYLGISSLDLDDDDEKMSINQGDQSLFNPGMNLSARAQSNSTTTSLLGRNGTLRNLLRQPEHSDTFRLNALADQFCQPLQEQLGDKSWLIHRDGEPWSVDCLALGYLSLMLHAEVPKRWLATAIKTRYPRLVQYHNKVYERIYDHFHSQGTDIPRQISSPPSTRQGLRLVLKHLVHFPSLFFKTEILHVDSHKSSAALELRQKYLPLFNRYPILRTFSVSIGFLGITAFAALGYIQWNTKREGDFVFTSRRPPPRYLSDFGEAEGFLSVLGDQMVFERNFELERDRINGLTVADAKIEVG